MSLSFNVVRKEYQSELEENIFKVSFTSLDEIYLGVKADLSKSSILMIAISPPPPRATPACVFEVPLPCWSARAASLAHAIVFEVPLPFWSGIATSLAHPVFERGRATLHGHC